MQSKWPVESSRSASSADPTRGDLDILMLNELDHALALVLVVLDDQQPLHRGVDEVGDLRERFVERFLRDRLLEVRERARLEPLLTLPHAEMMCTGMWRVCG
jgi:hypothetical protein